MARGTRVGAVYRIQKAPPFFRESLLTFLVRLFHENGKEFAGLVAFGKSDFTYGLSHLLLRNKQFIGDCVRQFHQVCSEYRISSI